jgi:ABC-type dipeptide/oligopeptide/nickel transport system ATPase subunit
MAERLLSLDHVSYAYGHDRESVVDDVSLVVDEGARVGMVGESGSGKTTLARIALGLVDATGGDVRYRGRELDRRTRILMRSECRMVFQNAEAMLNPGLTVRSLLHEPLRVHGFAGSAAAREEAARSALTRVGGEAGWLERTPRQLSGGERRRVALARALVHPPDLLVADEPVAGLDVVRQCEILDILDGELRSRSGAALIISHDLAVVERLCTEIHVMRHGVLVDTMRRTASGWSCPTHAYARRLFDASCELRGDFLEGRGAM